MIISEEDHLAHIGVIRRSGRYPWGSGDNPYQGARTFTAMVDKMHKKGMSQVDIARALGMTTTELRAQKSLAKSEIKAAQIHQAQTLKDKGWSNVAISKRMGVPESTVRSLLAPAAKDKLEVKAATTNMLRDQVAKKGFIDVGSGVEHHVGVSRNKLDIAIAELKAQGYEVHNVKIPQLGTSHKTELKVLAPPGTSQKEVWENRFNIKQIEDYSDDGGRTYLGIHPPVSVSSKRIKVNYAEDGGADADGVIYIRPGVDDLSLGASRYAQVRIAVDDTHFLKGMAVYKSDLPPGVDIAFNTNKSKKEASSDLDAMKPMKKNQDGSIDMDNPFGSTIARQNGAMNILSEEGDWRGWSKSLSSQVLSKQQPLLAKNQLEMMYERKRDEFDEIMKITNPAVKRILLQSLADDADSSAVHLKAAALPRQANHVILPVNSLKPTEVYAPNYSDGERLVLIRHPHGGIFEIPELTVNNRNREAKRVIGTQAKDAVGINAKVAERLSGADFDGDTVLVIPNNSGKIKTAPMLEGLKNFDPKREYPGYEGMKEMTPRAKQQQMGDISNLITDMTIRGASGPELARAVRHSMVVIDAEKHTLNYKLSAEQNGIPALKERYQGGKRAGASTLISKAGSEIRLPERKPRPAAEGGPIDKATGKLVFVPTGATKTDKKGNVVPKLEKHEKLAVTDDARTLSSGTPIERIYADHSNRLKSLANTARREMVHTKNATISPSAKVTYADEVASLNAKLRIAERNAPRERQAQVTANAVLAQKRKANPGMEPAEVKKIKNQALAEARSRINPDKKRLEITPKEWDAIQAGAISNNKLEGILRHADLDRVKELATPKTKPTMTTAKVNLAKTMANAGFTQAEIAERLGVSASLVTDTLSEGG